MYRRPIIHPLILIFILFAALFLSMNSCAVDEVEAEGDVSTASGAVTVTPLPEPCPFSDGWNLTVLTGTPALLPSCAKVVWSYSALEDSWSFWGRDNAPYWNDLNSFEWGHGYWLYAERGK